MGPDRDHDGDAAPLSAEPDWLVGIARAPSREPATEPRVPFTLAHFRVLDRLRPGDHGAGAHRRRNAWLSSPALSPDGRTLALHEISFDTDVWLLTPR